MSTIQVFKTYACATAENFQVSLEPSGGTVKTGAQAWNFKLDQTEQTKIVSLETSISLTGALATLEALFGLDPACQKISLSSAHPELKNLLASKTDSLEVSRTDFFQLRPLWVHNGLENVGPERWTETKEVQHPVRSRIQEGQVLYQRTIPGIDKVLRFRVADIEKDLDIFHEWHNQPRVLKFWELDKPKEELRDYLKKGLQDPHQFPVILEFDETPIGYFEMYWTKEDRLGPYYDSEAFDRGFHFLIGNIEVLGFKNTDAILKAVCHYLFLEEPRTRKIMAEPRSDNTNVLKYLETFKAWRKVKEFDFPHKRAALLECKRELFFGNNYL
ncbi:aerobactin siderophore biosynthesis protein iucB [Bdellovibrio bacteriovorus]|uniref:Aerobactin siderophore biosynthesis protein iucB n=1 Tax=Bdellovibrio bacteriovorus TaxID=959 RepID=A0A150WDN1_BDEBC|nr:GNAT family N-acetyltransferase [Bdellovibrio bacteriovorus]KYG61073.1 aerobactin siderophore biosynthesis protein iucB [Bdellovibrio bacteriovorus]